jgi:hypothetical protein
MPVFQTDTNSLIWQWAGAVRHPSPRRKPKVGFPALHRPGLSQVCPVSALSHGPAAGFYQAFTVAATQRGAAQHRQG